MQIRLKDTVEFNRRSTPDDAQDPVRADGVTIAPFNAADGSDDTVHRHYKLWFDVTYTVPDDMGAALVGLDLAEEV